MKPDSVIFDVAGANGLVLLSVLPSAIKVPLKVASVLPLPKGVCSRDDIAVGDVVGKFEL